MSGAFDSIGGPDGILNHVVNFRNPYHSLNVMILPFVLAPAGILENKTGLYPTSIPFSPPQNHRYSMDVRISAMGFYVRNEAKVRNSLRGMLVLK